MNDGIKILPHPPHESVVRPFSMSWIIALGIWKRHLEQLFPWINEITSESCDDFKRLRYNVFRLSGSWLSRRLILDWKLLILLSSSWQGVAVPYCSVWPVHCETCGCVRKPRWTTRQTQKNRACHLRSHLVARQSTVPPARALEPTAPGNQGEN